MTFRYDLPFLPSIPFVIYSLPGPIHKMTINNSPAISVHITITIDPSNNAAFLEALRPTFEAATQEPLNTSMEVFQDANTPGVFRIVENWNASIDYMMSVRSLLLTQPTDEGPQVNSRRNRFRGIRTTTSHILQQLNPCI